MGSRDFYIKVLLRLLLLSAAIFVLSYCLLHELYLRSIYLSVFVLALIYELFRFLNRFDEHLKIFLTSILQRDFTMHFKEGADARQNENLYQYLNKISMLFKEISSEKEIQHRYLEMLVQHISIGILSFDEEANVYLVNKGFLDLAGKGHISQLHQLQNTRSDLYEVIMSLKAGDNTMFKLLQGNQIVNVSIQATAFKLDGKLYKLISFQDITQQLHVNEMEAWQKLIRVLTHEIMNSVSPIISLSGTLHTIAVHKDVFKNENQNDVEAIQRGIEAIRVRSEGLYQFTKKYRALTQISLPDFQPTEIDAFILKIIALYDSTLKDSRIQCSYERSHINYVVDASLLQQVIINLLQNAIDACKGVIDGQIMIKSYLSANRLFIEVTDNGPGINPEDLEKIFIPFFTTKAGGSGIGLALSRQIIALHKGEFTVTSKPGETVFKIVI